MQSMEVAWEASIMKAVKLRNAYPYWLGACFQARATWQVGGLWLLPAGRRGGGGT